MPEGPFLNTPVPLTGTNSQRICLIACPYGGRSIDEWMQSLRLREHTPEAKPDQLVVGTRQRNVRVAPGLAQEFPKDLGHTPAPRWVRHPVADIR